MNTRTTAKVIIMFSLILLCNPTRGLAFSFLSEASSGQANQKNNISSFNLPNFSVAANSDNLDASATRTLFKDGQKKLSRGEVVSKIVDYLDLRDKNNHFINQCDFDLGVCMFSFSTMTNFHDFNASEEQFFPDVDRNHPNFEDISLATKLDLIRGYNNEPESPFKPDQTMKRIEALKIIASANGTLIWKEKVELQKSEMIWMGVDYSSTNKWWYPRYLNLANKIGLGSFDDIMLVDKPLNESELLYLLDVLAGIQAEM